MDTSTEEEAGLVAGPPDHKATIDEAAEPERDTRSRRQHVAAVLRTATAVVAGLILIVMAALMIVGVFARYVLHEPLPGITDIVGDMMMVAVVYLAVPSARHIRVSVVVSRLHGRVRTVVDTISLLIVIAVLAVGIYAAYVQAMASYASGESTTGVITIHLYPFRLLVLLGLVLTLLRVLAVRSKWLALEEETTTAETPPVPTSNDRA